MIKYSFAKKYFLSIILLGVVYAQTEIVVLSQNVGSLIDRHENRYYKIFPDEKGLFNAQISKVNESKFRVTIVKKIRGKSKRMKRYISLKEFEKLKEHVDSQPKLTEKEKIAMYKGLDFLRAEKIVNEIPKPQYVELLHSGQKKLKGTLILVEDNMLHIQTSTDIEKIHLDNLDQLSYRSEIKDLNKLRPYIYTFTGLAGLTLARIYNSQRSTIYNENGIPRNDLKGYTQLFGIVIGLIFSSELFDAVSTLMTPSETIILSEAEYKKKNVK
ncbi:MAG: hypothetical protein HOL10_09565 [Candidatus Marinimicrobia bacterium]|nr:hypothetical protein [Candidatus Neomarinimicrobiota bacterium]MBT5760465.1 hypothetical protein [Candidatus Neomarinimicrobiota bacterium]